MSGNSAPAKHNVTIDRLRGLCVLAVVGLHYTFFFGGVPAFLKPAIENGYYGVTTFFCVSGFLITTNLLKRYGRVAKVDLYAFYVMRLGRIIPPLILLCLMLSLLSLTTIRHFVFTAGLTLQDTLISIITLRYNLYYKERGAMMPVWAILWSLSIEEMFYLVYPLTAKIVRNTFLLVPVLAGIIVYGPIHRMPGVIQSYDYFGCFDGIAMGILSALVARQYSTATPRRLSQGLMIAGSLISLGAYIFLKVTLHFVLGPSLVAFGGALILFASQCPAFASTRPSSIDPLAHMGRISYEMYLFHMMVFALLCDLMPRLATHPVLIFGTAAISVVAVGDMVSRSYAEPLNSRIRRWLLPARESSVMRSTLSQSDRLGRLARFFRRDDA